jgi:adenosylhomocysteine nucleosidase
VGDVTALRPAIGVVTGLGFEASCLRRNVPSPEHFPVALSGGDPSRALAESRRLIAEGAVGLVSFGTAGALSPALDAGDVIVATSVIRDSGGAIAAEQAWCDILAAAASAHRLAPHLGSIRAVEKPAASAAEKSALYRASGALAVDMESGAVAQAARNAGLPFAVVRVIVDPAMHEIPPAALAAIGPGGRMNYAGLARALWREPAQITALLTLARDAAIARRRLGRAAALLGVLAG